jgi:hypothetical protein
VHSVECDEKVVLTGQSVRRHIVQNVLDQAAHRAVHQVSVVN